MTMRLTAITAAARPGGNGIDLRWSYPDPGPRPDVRVVRNTGRYPAGPDDGVLVGDATGAVPDLGLRGETVYYYALFPHTGNPPVYDDDPHNRVSATATSPYDFAGQLMAMLPAVYHRYDAQLLPRPGTVALADEDKGQLRRFLSLPGHELDRIYSLARTLLGATEVENVDGALLPLLADWIGWRTNHGLPVDKQRNEIRFAPRIYQTIGGLDSLGATVARVTGWHSRPKEYVHNVARTNQPERLNLWSLIRDPGGVHLDPEPASVNFAYDGRPAVVRDTDGSALVLYHTHRRHGWDIWAKRYTPTGGWQPSGPLIDRPGLDKHPAVALTAGRLWLFWQSWNPADDPDDRHWRVWFATRTGEKWSAAAVFGDDGTERMTPTAAADNAGGVWLFWRERTAGGWQVRYNRHDGTRWQLDNAQRFPLDSTADPRVEEDLQVLLDPAAATQPIRLFWTRQEPLEPDGQTRRTIAYRAKNSLDPATPDWSAVSTLPKDGTGAYHDRHPFPMPVAGGAVDLLWSSTRGGAPTVVRSTLSGTPPAWSPAQTVVPGPASARAPAALDLDDGRRLIVYRSNRALTYQNGALQTEDQRYAGTTTVDTRNAAKIAEYGTFDDFQTYLYDAGTGGRRDNDDRIARDTVGLFLVPTVPDPAQRALAIARLAETLRDFMPVTARAVFITPP